MEDNAEVAQKDTEAYTLLQTLQGKHSPGSTTFYLRRNDYTEKRFLELDLEKLRHLENEGVLKMSEYVRPATGIIEPNIIQLDLSPKGEQVLKSRTTITETKTTVQETFQEAEAEKKKPRIDFTEEPDQSPTLE